MGADLGKHPISSSSSLFYLHHETLHALNSDCWKNTLASRRPSGFTLTEARSEHFQEMVRPYEFTTRDCVVALIHVLCWRFLHDHELTWQDLQYEMSSSQNGDLTHSNSLGRFGTRRAKEIALCQDETAHERLSTEPLVQVLLVSLGKGDDDDRWKRRGRFTRLDSIPFEVVHQPCATTTLASQKRTFSERNSAYFIEL